MYVHPILRQEGNQNFFVINYTWGSLSALIHVNLRTLRSNIIYPHFMDDETDSEGLFPQLNAVSTASFWLFSFF